MQCKCSSLSRGLVAGCYTGNCPAGNPPDGHAIGEFRYHSAPFSAFALTVVQESTGEFACRSNAFCSHQAVYCRLTRRRGVIETARASEQIGRLRGYNGLSAALTEDLIRPPPGARENSAPAPHGSGAHWLVPLQLRLEQPADMSG